MMDNQTANIILYRVIDMDNNNKKNLEHPNKGEVSCHSQTRK